jgi:hypothetical protein
MVSSGAKLAGAFERGESARDQAYTKAPEAYKYVYFGGLFLAPQVGLEPTTLRLTAECSTIELLRSKMARPLS